MGTDTDVQYEIPVTRWHGHSWLCSIFRLIRIAGILENGTQGRMPVPQITQIGEAALRASANSFPFDGARRLVREIVEDSADAR